MIHDAKKTFFQQWVNSVKLNIIVDKKRPMCYLNCQHPSGFFFFFRLYLVSFTRVLYNGKQTWKTVTNSFKNLSWVLAGNDLKSSFSCFTILLHKPGLTEMLSEYQIAVFYWSALSLEGMNRSFSILWCSYTCTKEANWGHNVSLLVVKHV